MELVVITITVDDEKRQCAAKIFYYLYFIVRKETTSRTVTVHIGETKAYARISVMPIGY